MGCTVQSMLRSGRSVRILGCEVHSRSRTPHGVRGLKYQRVLRLFLTAGSHPSRGAWIEIPSPPPWSSRSGRTPHGVRGLKSFAVKGMSRWDGRTPHGVRGLKSHRFWPKPKPNLRRTPHGVRGLKYLSGRHYDTAIQSHPSRGAWIEIETFYGSMRDASSHPSRGAWIEIRHTPCRCQPAVVAPLTGCVD